jgi:hypothetical protein
MDEIFYLMRHGGGGFSWAECYNMPTQVRKYNVRKLSAEIQEENDKREAAAKGESSSKTMEQMAAGTVKGFGKGKQPDYIAKAPTKR